MKEITVTWTETYTIFEPGDKVLASCEVDHDKPWDHVYTVESCIEPKFAGDTATVFLYGVRQGWDASYFRLAE